MLRLLVLAALATLPAAAQTLRSPGAQARGGFGTTLVSTGDLTGDGVSDLLVGAYAEGASGRAYVYDGASRALVRTLDPPQTRRATAFGVALAALGDLDGDGVPDLAIGAPGENAVYLFSGRDGRLVRTLRAPPGGAVFGHALAPAGDADGDGAADVIVGDYKRRQGGLAEAGEATVVSGRTGERLFVLTAPTAEAGAHFGRAVAGGRDLTGDGVSDWAVAARYEDAALPDAGRVHVFSGRDGAYAWSAESPTPAVRGSFGLAVALCPDLDADGLAEVAVGAIGEDRQGDGERGAGRVHLFSGRGVLHTLASPTPAEEGRFGQGVDCAGDLTGDGLADIVVGAIGEGPRESGTVHVFSGATGAPVAILAMPGAEVDARFGIAVGVVVDAAGRGLAVATGAGQADRSGAVYVEAPRLGAVPLASARPTAPPDEGLPRVGRALLSAATGRARVRLTLSRPDDVLVQVVDATGWAVVQRLIGRLGAGTHDLDVDADAGRLAPGTYEIRVRAGRRVATLPLHVSRAGR